MHTTKYPFGVRLLGFSPAESAQIAAALARSPTAGPAYSCLPESSLQAPDFYIGNGDDLKAVAAMVAASPGPVQPGLLIGNPELNLADLPFPCLPRPLDALRLCSQMAALVDQRAEAVARLSMRGMPVVPERRRNPRLDLDTTDPLEYVARRREPPCGAVLILDHKGALRDHVARLLKGGPHGRAVEWTDSARTAVRLCEETPVAVVLLNTSVPGTDPYALCAAIKARPEAARVAVVLLAGPTFAYDAARAAQAGLRGYLDKPVADRHLLGALKKLLSLPA